MPVGIENLKLLKEIEFDFLLPIESKGLLQSPFKLVGSSRSTAIDHAIEVLERRQR